MAKQFYLCLMDDTQDGRVRITANSWSGALYRLKPNHWLMSDPDTGKETYLLPSCPFALSSSKVSSNPRGIYFLFGKKKDRTGECLYIGQVHPKRFEAFNLSVLEHLKRGSLDQIEYMLFVSTPKMSASQLDYLEKRCYDIFTTRSNVINEITPLGATLESSKEMDCETFLEITLKLIPFLQYPAMQPKTKTAEIDRSTHKIPITLNIPCANGQIVEAQGLFSKNACIVLKGAKVAIHHRSEIPAYLVTLRKLHKERGILQPDGQGLFELQENIEFPNASSAASYLSGELRSGTASWKASNDVRLDLFLKGNRVPTSSKPQPRRPDKKGIYRFHCSDVSETGALFEGRGVKIKEGIRVEKGALVNIQTDIAVVTSIKQLKSKHLATGILIPINQEVARLTEDVDFADASIAASYICGKPLDGRVAWTNVENGDFFGEYL